MQFKGKLMNQTWENGKKANFGPDFGLFGPSLLLPLPPLPPPRQTFFASFIFTSS